MGVNYVILFDECNKDGKLVGLGKTTTINAETKKEAIEKFRQSSPNHKYSKIKKITPCE